MSSSAVPSDPRPVGDVLDPWTLLDLSRFGESRGDDALVELMDAFFREATERVERLEQAAASRDLTLMGDIAHGLRGASLSLAATRLADCCFEIEGAASRADIDAACCSVVELEPRLEEVRAALTRLFGNPSSKRRMENR